MAFVSQKFETLPIDIQEKVKDVLKAYHEVTVIFENGTYNVSTGSCIQAKYAPDHKVVGYYTNTEIYTEDERTINYIESFHEYPANWKGRRDYLKIKCLNLLGYGTKIKLTETGFEILPK